MSNTALLLLVAGVVAPAAASAQMPASELRDSSRAALVRDVTTLASSAWDGRATGSAGSQSALAYLARIYQEMQIDPGVVRGPCDSAGACARGYFQVFAMPPGPLMAAGIDTAARGVNVIAIVPGTDDALAREWIVVGAHHDHLGRTGLGARDRQTRHLPHLGADDNASGTAAVLELARRIAVAPPRRSVLFVHFGAEELGLYGSTAFMREPPVPRTSMVAMINLDMVGRLGGKRLTVFGTGTASAWPELLARASQSSGVPLSPSEALGARNTGSDHMPFALAGVPSLHLFSGQHSAYHTEDDIARLVDFDGLVRVVEFAESLVRLMADMAAVPVHATPRP